MQVLNYKVAEQIDLNYNPLISKSLQGDLKSEVVDEIQKNEDKVHEDVIDRNNEMIDLPVKDVTDEIKERVNNYQIFKMHDEIRDLKERLEVSQDLNKKIFRMLAKKIDQRNQ